MKSQIGNSVIYHLNRKRAALNNDLMEHALFKANWVAWLLPLPSREVSVVTTSPFYRRKMEAETLGWGFLLHASETSVSLSSTCTRGGTLYPRAPRGFYAGASSTHEGTGAWTGDLTDSEPTNSDGLHSSVSKERARRDFTFIE